MLDEIKNSLKDRLDTNNFFLGILFIILALISAYSLDFEFIQNNLFKYLKETFNNGFEKIPVFESLILIFIINIIGYLINFTFKAIYILTEDFIHNTESIKKFYFNILKSLLKSLLKLHIVNKILQFIRKFIVPRKHIPISRKVILKALSLNSKLLIGITDQNKKHYMSQLYLTLFIKKKDENLYKDFIHRINKLKFYQNIICLIYFFVFFIIIIKSGIALNSYFIENTLTNNPVEITFSSNANTNPSIPQEEIKTIEKSPEKYINKNSNNDIQILVFFLLVFLPVISTYTTYKTFQDDIDVELLVFIEMVDLKIEK